MACVLDFIKNNKDSIFSILPSLCTIIVAIISSYTVVLSARKNQREVTANKLRDNLENFYYPFLLLAKKTSQLYDALNDVSQIGDNENGCIHYLLSGKKFEGNSKTLFEQILNNDIELNSLILKNSHVVSNDILRQELAKLSTHYTLLELAYNGDLFENQELLSKYSFPSHVIDNLEIEISNIKEQISKYDSLYK